MAVNTVNNVLLHYNNGFKIPLPYTLTTSSEIEIQGGCTNSCL